MGINKKILLILSVLVLFNLFTVLLNFFTYIGLESDAPFINLSGSERMRMFKMSFLSSQLNNNSKAEYLKILNDENTKFDKILNGLINGDKTLKLNPLQNENIKNQLIEVKSKWNSTFNNKLQEAVLKDDGSEIRAMTPEILKYVDSINNIVSEYDKESQKKVYMAKILNIIAIIISVISMILGFIIVRKRITKPLNQVVERLNDSSIQTKSSSNQVSESSQHLADSNMKQAESIQETSQTIRKLFGMSSNNKENVAIVTSLAIETSESAHVAKTEMGEMTNAISEIHDASNKMSKIVKVIDEIAFQTNILALNAAVEAARAGDAGAGFSVVAEEVRSLAHKTANATKDISEIIKVTISLTDKGVNVVAKAESSILNIDEKTQKVKILLEEVLESVQEQIKGISEIQNAISEIENVTQANAATSEETAACSEELYAQAELLNEVVEKLVILTNGIK